MSIEIVRDINKHNLVHTIKDVCICNIYKIINFDNEDISSECKLVLPKRKFVKEEYKFKHIFKKRKLIKTDIEGGIDVSKYFFNILYEFPCNCVAKFWKGNYHINYYKYTFDCEYSSSNTYIYCIDKNASIFKPGYIKIYSIKRCLSYICL